MKKIFCIGLIVLPLLAFGSPNEKDSFCAGILMGKFSAIISKMEKSGAARALNYSAEFLNTCVLDCSLLASEAMRQYYGQPARPAAELKSVAQQIMPTIKKVVGRNDNGLNLIDASYVTRVLLRDAELNDEVQVETKTVKSLKDLNLRPDEIMLIGAQLKFTDEFHMLLAYYSVDGHLLVFDPLSGSSVGYVTATSDGGISLNNGRSPQEDRLAILNVKAVIKLRASIAGKEMPEDILKMETDFEQAMHDLLTLKKILGREIELGPTTGSADHEEGVSKNMTQLTLTYTESKKAFDTEVYDFGNFDVAAKILELRHRVAEISDLMAQSKALMASEPRFDLESSLRPLIARLNALKVRRDIWTFDELNSLRLAVESYADLAVAMGPDISPNDRHQKLDSYFELLQTVFNSPGASDALEGNELLRELMIPQWDTILRARTKFGK